MTSLAAPHVSILPGGHLDDRGILHRAAELAPLTGREEELLTTFGDETTAALVTQILCHCVSGIGTVRPVTAEVARQLLVADRQFLLLRIRELTFGDRCTGTLACPWPGCAAKVDIDFSTHDIPIRAAAEIAPSYRLELSADAAVPDASGHMHRTLTFRLPNGADQEAVAPVIASQPAHALTRLLERCVIGTDTPRDDIADIVSRLPAQARQELEQALEAHAPAVDLDMELTCPECGRRFTTPLDLADFFLGELRTSRDLLYRQVHYIAFHYHWSEREILALPREKRHAYIEILAEEIEAINSAS